MKKTLFILGSLLTTMAFSQQKTDQFTTWWNLNANHVFSDKISAQTMYSFRRFDGVEQWQQSLLRLGFNYHVNSKFTVTPGYDWVVTYPYGDQPAPGKNTEHRIFQQFVTKNKIGRFSTSNRFRFEQRFLENLLVDGNAIKSDGYRFRQRIRGKFGFSVPLNNSKIESKTLFLDVWDEVFVNYGSGVNNHYFDQNWLYLGFGYKLSPNTTVKLGYMNQYINKSNNYNIENNHSIQVSASVKINHKKKGNKE